MTVATIKLDHDFPEDVRSRIATTLLEAGFRPNDSGAFVIPTNGADNVGIIKMALEDAGLYPIFDSGSDHNPYTH